MLCFILHILVNMILCKLEALERTYKDPVVDLIRADVLDVAAASVSVQRGTVNILLHLHSFGSRCCKLELHPWREEGARKSETLLDRKIIII